MRIYDRWILKLLAVFAMAACAVIQGQSPPKQRIDPGLESLGGEFVSGIAPAGGTPPPLRSRWGGAGRHLAAPLPRRPVRVSPRHAAVGEAAYGSGS
jgi:hypothetical protein